VKDLRELKEGSPDVRRRSVEPDPERRVRPMDQPLLHLDEDGAGARFV